VIVHYGLHTFLSSDGAGAIFKLLLRLYAFREVWTLKMC
jgi:hypothetical protein